MLKRFTLPALLAAGLCLAATGWASSHREAPLIAADPLADNLDVYAFRSPDNLNSISFVATFFPLEEPAGGPNFYRFGDDVLYSFYVDNDGDAKADIQFNFRFRTVYGRKNTFLYNDGPISSLADPHFNVRQYYTLTRVDLKDHGNGRGRETVLGTDLPVPPVNIGPASTPNYEALSNSAIRTLPGGYKVWAGQSDDPFFVDLGAVFDLLTIRNGAPGNTGGGKDAVAGYNSQTIVLQVPIAALSRTGGMPSGVDDPNAVIGMWSITSRQRINALGRNGYDRDFGQWQEVSRLGMPLVNEVVIPLEDKDRWNASEPSGDVQFLQYVQHPEPAALLNALYGLPLPPEPRQDLVAVFLTGLDLLKNKPANVVPSEQVRLNMLTPLAATPSALGALGGDVAGFPNGRRLADDVTDIELRALAGVLLPLFGSSFTPPAIAGMLGDGVDANDLPFRAGFPYVALPHQGFANAKGVLTPVHPPMSPHILGDKLGREGSSGARTLLAQNKPNPFGPATEIRFALARAGRASIRIYNVQGELVRTLVDQDLAGGEHVARWEGTRDAGGRAGAGLYFYRLSVGGEEIQKKMILAR